MTFRFLLAALTLAGCGQIPKDPDGTLERVRAERTFRVGVIAAGAERIGEGVQAAFLHRVAAATGARPIVQEGGAELLLTDLEEGRLDLVTGAVAPDSPWVDRVAMLRPLGESVAGARHIVVSPIARHGENAWIMLLERESRAVAAQGPPP